MRSRVDRSRSGSGATCGASPHGVPTGGNRDPVPRAPAASTRPKTSAGRSRPRRRSDARSPSAITVRRSSSRVRDRCAPAMIVRNGAPAGRKADDHRARPLPGAFARAGNDAPVSTKRPGGQGCSAHHHRTRVTPSRETSRNARHGGRGTPASRVRGRVSGAPECITPPRPAGSTTVSDRASAGRNSPLASDHCATAVLLLVIVRVLNMCRPGARNA